MGGGTGPTPANPIEPVTLTPGLTKSDLFPPTASPSSTLQTAFPVVPPSTEEAPEEGTIPFKVDLVFARLNYLTTNVTILETVLVDVLARDYDATALSGWL